MKAKPAQVLWPCPVCTSKLVLQAKDPAKVICRSCGKIRPSEAPADAPGRIRAVDDFDAIGIGLARVRAERLSEATSAGFEEDGV